MQSVLEPSSCRIGARGGMLACTLVAVACRTVVVVAHAMVVACAMVVVQTMLVVVVVPV